MKREGLALIKIAAAVAAAIAAVVAVVLLVVKYKEEIADFFAELKMKCPCTSREEDDYADEELNLICDLDEIVQKDEA